MNNTMIVNGNGGLRGLLAPFHRSWKYLGQTEILRDNLQQEKEVTARLEGIDLWPGHRRGAKSS